MRRKFKLSLLCRRYTDGGAAGGTETTPAPATTAPIAAEPAAQTAQTEPAAPATAPAAETKPAEPAKSFTQTEVENAVKTALDSYKQAQENAKDFEKMSAEQKVTYLQAQMADQKLSESAAKKLGEAGLSADFLPFVKGKDDADIVSKIANLKTVYDAAVQAGVEKRFKDNGYTPQGGSANSTAFASTGDPLKDAVMEAMKQY